MPLGDLKELAAAMQNLAVTLAILVGGAWTLYTFMRLRYIEKSKAELKELEQRTREQAVVDVNLEAVQLATDDGTRVVSATAVVKNKGNRNVYLDLQVARWSTARVSFDSDGGVILRDKKGADFDFVGHWVRVGGVVRFPTVISIREAGIYRIEFAVPVSPSDVLSPSQKAQNETSRKWWWIGRKYVAVA
ncbi:MAG TPA: hypothetical protein VIW64_05690 [Pyrinomonadaceae bacterium]|jgi:hypothetical protein